MALPYNGFAHQADRTLGEGLKDICTLYRARAFKVDLDPQSMKTSNSDGIEDIGGESNFEISGAALYAIPHTPTTSALCIELVGSRFLRQMVRILVVSKQHHGLAVRRILCCVILLCALTPSLHLFQFMC